MYTSSSNRKILFVTYRYVPEVHVSVLRIDRFVKHLSGRGWVPYVVTSSESKDIKRRIYRVEDPLAGLRISGVPSGPGENSRNTLTGYKKRIVRFARKWLVFPDEQLLWSLLTLYRCIRIVKKERISVVVTTSPPPSIGLIGLVLKKRFGIRWVSDYRDNWTKNFAGIFPTSFHAWLADVLERLFFRQADRISHVQLDMFDRLLYSGKARQIINAYSENDFLRAKPHPRKEGEFTILYTGTFYGKQSPVSLLDGLAGFKEKYPGEYADTRFVFAGISHDVDIAEKAKEWGIAECIHAIGPISHEKAISQMLSADVLLLIIGKTSTYNTVYTGKLFEYLRALKPILLIGQQNGVAADILRGHEGCRIVDFTDVDTISETLHELFGRWKRGLGCNHEETASLYSSVETSKVFETLVTD